MATQDATNFGGTGDVKETAPPKTGEENKTHHYSEDDHDIADWEGEGGNHGHVHDHGEHRAKVQEIQQRLAAEKGEEATKEEGPDQGDGSIRDLNVPVQRLDQISPENQEILKTLAQRIWSDGFALIGGVIPIKADGQGGYTIDEAREHGTINNIGSFNEHELGKLFLWLATQTIDPTKASIEFGGR